MDCVSDPTTTLAEIASQTLRSAIVFFPSVHLFRSSLRMLRYRLLLCPHALYREGEFWRAMRSVSFTPVEVEYVPGAGMDYVAIGRMRDGS
ncbi:MAG TPA: hypothetical protein VKB38_22190 [Terracidiphilus sp.]|nr:hypothetical protein [Terracidiphilus sp.]